MAVRRWRSPSRELQKLRKKPEAKPNAKTFLAYVAAMQAGWKHRFKIMGDAGEKTAPTSTTHISVIDRDGNMVTLTQTLLSLFGSRIVLPQSGILMNNGINWFDPTPGGPNSIAPDARALANYVPAIMTGAARRSRSAAAAAARSCRRCSSFSPCRRTSASISKRPSISRASTSPTSRRSSSIAACRKA